MSNPQLQASSVQSLPTAQPLPNSPQTPSNANQPVSAVQPATNQPEPSPALPPPPVTGPGPKIPWRTWFKAKPYSVALGFVLLVTLVSGSFGLGRLLRSGPSAPSSPLASQSDQALATDAAGSILTLNLDTVLAKGKKLTLSQLVADPTSVTPGILQLAGDLQASGTLGASGGSSSLNNSGLVINNKVVCTADGCSINRVPGPNGLTALPNEVTLLGNTFNGASQLVQLTAGGLLPVLSGANLTVLNASNLASGTIADARLSSGVTLQGNSFNTASQLVQLTTGGLLPVLSGANLTSLNATNISSGSLADARLSANVALLAGSGPQTFTGNNRFNGTFLAQNAADSTAAFSIQNAAGTSNLLIANTTSSRIAINQATATYTLDVAGDINSTTGVRVGGALLCNAGGCTAAGGSASYLQNGTALQTSANFNLQSAAITSVTGIIRALTGQTADLLQLKNQAAVNTLTVGPTGNTLIQPSTNSINAFSVQNAAGTSLLISGDTLNARVAIATAIPPAYTLDVGGDINTSTGLRVNGALVCSTTCTPGSGSSSYIQNDATAVQTANYAIQSALGTSIVAYIRGASGQSADLLDLVGKAAGDTNFPIATFSASGNILFQNAVNSTTAFQLQNLAGNNYILLNTTGASLSLGDTGIASTVQIGNTTGAVAQTINIGNNATAASTSTVVLGSTIGTSATTINSGTGAINIGNDSVAKTTTINVGAEATGADLVSLGSTNAASTLTLEAGTAATALQFGNGATAHGIQIGSNATGDNDILLGGANAGSTLTLEAGTAATAIQIGNGATVHGIQIGTGAAAQTVVLGSTTTTSVTTIQGGTGATAIGLQAGTSGTISVGTTNVNTVTIGSTANTGTLTFGQATTGETINIGNGNVATGNTNTINIGATATATGKNVVTIGSTVAASSLTLQGGSGNISINATAGTVTLQTTTSGAINITPASVDGTNIVLGTSDTVGTLLVLDTKTGAGDPTCTAGGIYYNSSDSTIRGCQDVPSGFTNLGNPPGTIVAYAGSTAPAGYLIADGSSLSRTTYATLFAVIGTTYGSVDGTHFTLPDLRGRTAVGLNTAEVGRTDVNALGNNEGAVIGSRTPYHMSSVVQPTISKPNVTVTDPGHTHGINIGITSIGTAGDTLAQANTNGSIEQRAQSKTTGITAALDATPTASGGTVGPQTNVPTDTPAYLTVNYIIKY